MKLTLERNKLNAVSFPALPYIPVYSLLATSSDVLPVESRRYCSIQLPVDDLNRLAGQTVTFSTWVLPSIESAVCFRITPRDIVGELTDISVTYHSPQVCPVIPGQWQRISVTATLDGIKSTTPRIDTEALFQIFLSDTAMTDMSSPPLTGQFEFALFQVEYGDTATDFEYRPDNVEFAMCQQFFRTSNVGSRNVGTLSRYAIPAIAETTGSLTGVRWDMPMKRTPNIRLFGIDGVEGSLSANNGGSDGNVTGFAPGTISETGFGRVVGPAVLTVGRAYRYLYDAEAELSQVGYTGTTENEE